MTQPTETSPFVLYKADLNRRHWEYQQLRFPNWQSYLERGRAPDGRPPVFLNTQAWRNVIAYPGASQDKVDRLIGLLPEADRHKWFRSMNSSQALAQSLFGNLAVHGYLPLVAEVEDDDGRPLLGEGQASFDNFSMEFKVHYLGEPRPTSLDVHFSGPYRIAIECKLTESEVGSCSRPGLKPADFNYAREYCNGTYTKQMARTERCALTHIAVKYWSYVPQLFQWKSDRDWNPCPLYRNYQLVRNVLAVGVRPDGSVSTHNGHAVVVYDERNPAFQKGGLGLQAYETTREALQEPTMLLKCSWQRIIGHLRNKNILPWLTEELALKYGL